MRDYASPKQRTGRLRVLRKEYGLTFWRVADILGIGHEMPKQWFSEGGQRIPGIYLVQLEKSLAGVAKRKTKEQKTLELKKMMVEEGWTPETVAILLGLKTVTVVAWLKGWPQTVPERRLSMLKKMTYRKSQ